MSVLGNETIDLTVLSPPAQSSAPDDRRLHRSQMTGNASPGRAGGKK